MEGVKMDILVERKPVKNARIQVLADGKVRVVAPPSFKVEDFIKKQAEWINKKLKEIEEFAKEIEGKEGLLLLEGEFYHLVEDERFEILDSVVKYRSMRDLKRKLAAMLREELRSTVSFYSRLLGIKYGRIFIKMQKTKWASCSSQRNLSFNLAILALPKRLREYIVVHELAHLIEPKHTKAFWEIVEFYYPDYRDAEKELKKYWVLVERNEIWKKLRSVR